MAFLEGEAVELVGGVEHAILEHAAELEVGLDRIVVERESCLPHLVGVKIPIPRLERKPPCCWSMSAWMSAASALALAVAGAVRLPRKRWTWSGVLAIWSCRRQAAKLGWPRSLAFSARSSASWHCRPRVVRVAAFGPGPRRLEELLARRPGRERREERLLRGVGERHDPLAVQMRESAAAAGRVEFGRRQAVEVGLVVHDERRILGRAEQLVLELRAERRVLLVEGLHRTLSASDSFAPAMTNCWY